ncbi:MAG: potassium channel family protein [Dehalococcoidia bacterium]
MLNIVEFVSGLLIVVIVLFDVFQTVLLPRPTPVTFRPSGRILGALYALLRRVVLHSPKRREQLLGMFAPCSVVVLLLYWGTGMALGYGLVLYALAAQIHPALNLGSALYFSAMSLLTFGFGDLVPTGGLARVAVIAEGATGLGLFALVITFLFALFGEFQRREVLVITLSARAGAPPSGLALLQTYANDGMVERLADVFADWEVWSAQVLDSHLSYPILAWFRSTHDNQSWLSALGAVLDAATFVLTTIEDVPRGPARLMRQGGVHLVTDLGQYFRVDAAQDPYVEEAEFAAACAHLRAAGYHLGDQQTAWNAFSRLRTEYAGALNEMARQWVTPPAEWIGDRSVDPRHRGSAIRR